MVCIFKLPTYVMALGLNTIKGLICKGIRPTHFLGFDV